MPLPADARLFAVVPAAGAGRRMGADCPKQYLPVAGLTVAEHTLTRLLAVSAIARLVVAVSEDDAVWPTLPVADDPRVTRVAGGETRAQSVLNALDLLVVDAAPDDWVLVHDVARPCLRASDVARLLAETGEQGAILAAPVVDTVKQRDSDGCIVRTLDRNQIWRALTPQLFPLAALRDALRQGLARGHDHGHRETLEITDEASAMEAIGWKPALVEGSADNIKLTMPGDLPLVAFYLAQQQREGESAS